MTVLNARNVDNNDDDDDQPLYTHNRIQCPTLSYNI